MARRTIAGMEPRAQNGLLIAVEGIDGAGKTTLVGRLEAFFRRAEFSVVRSKEPTDGPWGREIRATAQSGRIDPGEELRLFTEDRRQHVDSLIVPALSAGSVVILDRYFYSTAAYQGVAGAPRSKIEAATFDRFPIPDVTLLVDLPAELGVHRIREGREETPNAFEDLEQLRRVRYAFLEIAGRRPEVQILDGSRSADDVERAATRALLDGVLEERFCAKEYGCEQPEVCSYRLAGTCDWAKLKRAALP